MSQSLYFLLELKDVRADRKRRQEINVLQNKYEEQFNIIRNVYYDKQKELERLLKSRKILMADFTAAVVTSLYRAGALQNIDFIRDQINAVQKTILKLGFREADQDDMASFLRKSKELVAFVPGCQDESMLERRVACLLDFTIREQRAFTVVFSGRNPGTKEIETPVEADHMKRIYRDSMDLRQKEISFDVKIRAINRERKSRNTRQNLDKFLQSDEYFNKKIKTSLVVISSTFHLIRIAQHLIKLAGEKRRDGIKTFIDRIVLIGAENPNTNVWLRSDYPYLKLMLFELYNEYAR